MSQQEARTNPFYPERKADVVKHNERRCTIETDTVHATLFDNIWGYSVGYLKVWDDGHALLYCNSRRDVRFNLSDLPEEQRMFPTEAQAMDFFNREYAAALKNASEYGEKVLNTVREAGLPALTYHRDVDGVPITCIMQVGFSEDYVGGSVYVECTAQEALALINHPGIVAECKGSRYADFMWKYSGKEHGFLGWFSRGDTLSLGIGAYAIDGRFASCELAEWRRG